MADWRLRLWHRISFALTLATGISPAPLVPVLGSSLIVSALWLARVATCALARHRSECEFYLEHFVVQLYLCCLYFVYFLFMSFTHSRQFLHLYLSISVRMVYSFCLI